VLDAHTLVLLFIGNTVKVGYDALFSNAALAARWMLKQVQHDESLYNKLQFQMTRSVTTKPPA
jgi:hypothetical protein